MSEQPPTQRQVEFVAYVRIHGPITGNQATEYVRLNNLHEPDPYTISLLWLKAAIEAKEVQVYRDNEGGLLYGTPKRKKLDRLKPPAPVQTCLNRNAPPSTAQLAAQAAALATLLDQANPEKENPK